MNSPRSKMGYGGHRWHISTVGLYGVRAGGSPPSQVPEVALAKTSDLYVPYVPPVTDPGVLGMSPQHVRIIDLMLGDHGFIPSRTTASRPAKPRRGGRELHLQPVRPTLAWGSVIDVSPRHNIQAHLNNYAGISIVVFWSHIKKLLEITK